MKKSIPLFSWRFPALILFFLGLLISFGTHAQLALSFKDMETDLGFEIGPSFFLGDLGGNLGDGKRFVKDLNFPSTRYFLGVTGTMRPASWLGIRGGLNLGQLYGNDASTTGEDFASKGRRERNLDFRTNIFEAQLVFEFYPTDFLIPGDDLPRLRPYVVGGVGIFHFNPQGSYTNAAGQTTWVDLRPLHTEGEGFAPDAQDGQVYPAQYTLWQPNIPFGIGARYDLSDKVAISAELLDRFTFSDYIDDVSGQFVQDTTQFYKYLPPATAALAVKMANKSGLPITAFSTRGDPKDNDSYFTFTIRISIKFGSSDSWFGRASSEVRCPVRW
jgi:hypothetical protein